MALEIERKFLIKANAKTFPVLVRYYNKTPIEEAEIVQTYLHTERNTQTERRVRKKTVNGKTQFFYTEKKPVDDKGLVREEHEIEITEDDYNIYLEAFDESLLPIKKTRYTFVFEEQKLEFDFYDFCDSFAIMETELESTDTPITIPHYVEIIADVTSDKRFKNRNLAKSRTLQFFK